MIFKFREAQITQAMLHKKGFTCSESIFAYHRKKDPEIDHQDLIKDICYLNPDMDEIPKNKDMNPETPDTPKNLSSDQDDHIEKSETNLEEINEEAKTCALS